MKNEYLFTPFTNEGTIAGIKDWVKRAAKHDPKKEERTYIPVFDNLQEIATDSVLYVLGEFRGEEQVCNKAGEDVISPEELAKRIAQTYRLRTAHNTIKLWICYSGKGAMERKGIGYKFWKTMKENYHFNDLTVYAYTAIVMDPFSDFGAGRIVNKLAFRKNPDPIVAEYMPIALADDGESRASEYRVAINASGVTPPKKVLEET